MTKKPITLRLFRAIVQQRLMELELDDPSMQSIMKGIPNFLDVEYTTRPDGFRFQADTIIYTDPVYYADKSHGFITGLASLIKLGLHPDQLDAEIHLLIAELTGMVRNTFGDTSMVGGK